MAIKHTDRELKLIYEDLKFNKLVLPNFQRGFVWDRNKQRNLIASVLVDLPIGSLLILEGNSDDFSKRQLCFPNELEIDNKDCQYVLDGQQRLSTLRTVFYDIFSQDNDWKNVWDKLYGSLRTRWFLRVKPNDDEEDYFGYNNLRFHSVTNLTDNDVQEFIEYRIVHKTKINEAHHPDYMPVDEKGNKIDGEAHILNSIANSFAEEFTIPLYEIEKINKGIHRKVLNKIASKRIDELKVEADENKHSLDFYKSIFTEDIYETCENLEFLLTDVENIETNLAGLWAQLKSNWVSALATELEKLPSRVMSIIFLNRDEVNRAVAIFEAINQGGAPLSVYDLVVAKSARQKDKKNLSSRIIESVFSDIEIPIGLNAKYCNNNSSYWNSEVMGIIDGNEPSKQLQDWFVNILSLLVYVKDQNNPVKIDYLKREEILKLSSEQINTFTDRAIKSIVRALAFLLFKCGITSANEVSYKLMLIVLAFYLDDDSVWHDKKKLDRLECWYWISLLGGGYFTRQNEKCIDDLNDIKDFLDGSDLEKIFKRKDFILNYQDFVTKDILLRRDEDIEVEQNSVRRGILQFILSNNSYDFDIEQKNQITPWDIASGKLEVELHHIIPLGNATKLSQSTSELRSKKSHILNSPLNFAYISKEANRVISDKSPSEYLAYLEKMTLATHNIPDVNYFKEILNANGDSIKKYQDILERRYDAIQLTILNRINSLRN